MAAPKRVLVCDDDPVILKLLEVNLELEGYDVLSAHHGEMALKLALENVPDLVILDIMMPRMGGYPVLEHFRDKKDAPPIIMITANEGSRHKAYAEYLGVVDYIRKPFAMERLLESVERGLRQAAERKTEPGPQEA